MIHRLEGWNFHNYLTARASDGNVPIFTLATSYAMRELEDTTLGSQDIGLLLLRARWLPAACYLIDCITVQHGDANFQY